MQEVVVTKVEPTGTLFCRPKISDDESYIEFLAALNTKYEQKRGSETMYLPEVGQLCACYSPVTDSDCKLWYRGKILNLFNSPGFMAKVLLVDDGGIVCVTKARMRKLTEEFISFPHQYMKCSLADIDPITLRANTDLSTSLQKARLWDSSAIRYIEDLVAASNMFIETVGTDHELTRKVKLFMQKDDGSYINVNELLVKDKFATWKSTDNETLRKQKFVAHCPTDIADLTGETLCSRNTTPYKDLTANWVDAVTDNSSYITPVSKNTDRPVNHTHTEEHSIQTSPPSQKTPPSQTSPSSRLTPPSQRSSLQHTSPSPSHATQMLESYNQDVQRQVQKREQQQKIKQHASKDCQELLRLLNTDYSPHKVTTSGESASELSDMETTPVPKMLSYKHARSSRNAFDVLNDKLGKDATNFLARGLGIPEEECSSSNTPKKVSFSSHNMVLGPNSTCMSSDADTPLKPFSFIDMNVNVMKEGTKSKLADASDLLNALSVGAPSLKLSTRYTTPICDVLVNGKLKREAFRDIEDLNLPLPLKMSLKEMKFQTPTPFQTHMWPALMASRNIVGIADINKNNTSKILSYMLPLLKHLLSSGDKCNLVGRGNGPVVVVCVGGWSEAQEVYDVCELLTSSYHKNIRVDVRYGGMDNEEERNIRLINGCEILIITVPSLNKMVADGYTNMNRLCHIVFDDCDLLVEKFTEDIKLLMRTYAHNLKKLNRETCQIIAVGMKWSYGMHSLMSSYVIDPLVIIANRIETALYAKVPFVVELCNTCDRLEHLIGFLETDAVNENTIIFTNTAKAADDLQGQLNKYSICCDVLTEFKPPSEMKDSQAAWNAASKKNQSNILIMSDNAVLKAGIKNASCVVHYDFSQKKSDFGNRLNCLLDCIRENENKEPKKQLTSHVFVTEKDNGMRYSTGLVKLLKRSGQHIPELLKTMALASRELKEEQKQFFEICPRLKLFGHCSFIEDCQERHRIFCDKDLLGLCPSTGFIKVVILDVMSASNFWGRIVEHRLPYDPNNTAYDTTLYLKLSMDLQLHYKHAENCKKCYKVERYDVCVINTVQNGYQRVRIEAIVEKDLERPRKLKVFGIDGGFTKIVKFDELLICDEKLINIPPQAVEIIACCVKPVENGTSWTHEASCYIEKSVSNRTLEGRVQFSLQNTIWVDPLVEKEMQAGLQSTTYRVDVGRDLIRNGYAEKNMNHVENLRKLLYDVQGHPIKLTTAKQSLPIPMVEHDSAYLQDDDYEEVYVSAVTDPSLFFVQRMELYETILKLDDKIDATMVVTKINTDLSNDTFPIGYICVAQFSIDKRWYRGKVLAVSADQLKYDIFFIDHGDREWINKSKVHPAWPDILSLPAQAIECSFNNIIPISGEWSSEDGDLLWDLVQERLLHVKVLKTGASSYVCDTINYEVELSDTTGEQNKIISHELVYMGIAHGSLECLQEIFPHASVNKSKKLYQTEFDKCPDLCVEIHQQQDLEEKVRKVIELQSIMLKFPDDNDVLIENGSLQSLCSLLALSKRTEIQEVLLLCLQKVFLKNIRCKEVLLDNDVYKVLCDMLRKASSDHLKTVILTTLIITANDPWYHHVVHNLGLMRILCSCLNCDCEDELLKCVLQAISLFCEDNESNCAAVRQEDGLVSLCNIFQHSKDATILQCCADAFHSLLESKRNQERMRDIGGLSILSSLLNKNLTDKALKTTLECLTICIENNEANRDYLVKIEAHENLKRCAMLPLRYSMAVRKLFKELINQIVPAPVVIKEQHEEEINTTFSNKIDVLDIEDDETAETTLAPDTFWSQRRNTVTLSIHLRGVRWEETKIEESFVRFRTILDHVEYVLEIELYDKICVKESLVLVKGGEVLITLRKENLGDIWPRLLKDTTKIPYIRIDFDRWVDEYLDYDDTKTDDSLFMPGLPKPPPCLSYKLTAASLETFDTSSDGDTSRSDDEDDDDELDDLEGFSGGTRDDYFKL